MKFDSRIPVYSVKVGIKSRVEVKKCVTKQTNTCIYIYSLHEHMKKHKNAAEQNQKTD